ncbi:TonB-dependent receptor [Desulfovibrio inopinatus]|uniref:TonB-dependent receptor n=1 Tax=Desulfovibrio inopinatus TaxID=102109 RepID=UPI00146FC188|nr:TonB-dependent receptor [Desulfovibrio inopinatus]
MAIMFLLFTMPVFAADNADEESITPSMDMDAIVVRADKMQEDVQSIPSSVSVLSSDDVEIRQVEKTKDIFKVNPNMFFVKSGPDAHEGDSFASVRGITSFMSGAPVLGFYVDDIYYPGYEIPLFDVDRVEVLRGPQGTLYGRNSEAGIISIFTKKANKDVWEGKLTETYGSYNTTTTTGMVSGPLVRDVLSMRIAGQFEHSDGYFKNDHSGSNTVDQHDDWVGRASFDWSPSTDFRLTLNVDGEAYEGNYAEFNTLSKVYSDPHEVDVDWDGLARRRALGASLRAEWNFDSAKLLSITSVRDTHSRGDQDMDFTIEDLTRYYITENNQMFTQEFRLQSPEESDSPFKWLVGTFMFAESDMLRYKYAAGSADPYVANNYYFQRGTTSSRGLAVFGQGVYSFGPVDLTLGLRYDYENKDFYYTNGATPAMVEMWGMTNATGSNSNSYGAWLPKAALSWHATDNLMPYASVSRGYRGGGFNLAQNTGSAYDPEYTWNFEAGVKTQWLENKLKFNFSAFYIDWTDIQVLQPNYPNFAIENAGKAYSQGLEAQFSWNVVPGLNLYGNAGYTDARFVEYSDDDGDYSGNRIPNVPRYTATFGGVYRFLDNYMVNADIMTVGDIEWDSANSESQDIYNILNAKIGYEGDNIDVYLWGKNLFNVNYATRAFIMNDQWYGRAGDPLRVGITLSYRF